MPARLRLAEAARQLEVGDDEEYKAAQTMLVGELRKMERVRCILCDGRGHSDKSAGGVSRPNERCPMRAILRRRMGKGKLARRTLNLAIASVIAEDKPTFKYGNAGQTFKQGRQLGKYCAATHLAAILTKWEAEKHGDDEDKVPTTTTSVADYVV